MKARSMALAGLIAATAVLGGCAVSPAYDSYAVETVYVAPPPPRVEYVGPPPVVGHIWISGYWNWGGARYVWVPGRWEAPRHGYRWVPHRWEQRGNQWHRYGGRWESEGYRDGHRGGPAREERHERYERRDDRDARHHERRGEDRPSPRPLAQPHWQAPQPVVVEAPRPPVRDVVREERRDERRDGWRGEREARPAREAGPSPQMQGAPGAGRGGWGMDRGAERRERPQEARNDRPERGERRDADERGRDRERERRHREEGRQG